MKSCKSTKRKSLNSLEKIFKLDKQHLGITKSCSPPAENKTKKKKKQTVEIVTKGKIDLETKFAFCLKNASNYKEKRKKNTLKSRWNQKPMVGMEVL